MVTKWGLSDQLGPQTYSEDEGEVFLGRSVTQHKQVSDETAHMIDQEISHVIDENYQRALQILTEHRDILELMADALMRYETIDESQLKDIMQGKQPEPPEDWDSQDHPPAGKGKDDNVKKKDDTSIGGPAEQH